MVRTIEAIISEGGEVELLEPLTLTARHRALVTILEEVIPVDQLRPYGLAKGLFDVPSDFDAPLPEDILDDFDRSSSS